MVVRVVGIVIGGGEGRTERPCQPSPPACMVVRAVVTDTITVVVGAVTAVTLEMHTTHPQVVRQSQTGHTRGH